MPVEFEIQIWDQGIWIMDRVMVRVGVRVGVGIRVKVELPVTDR